MNTSNSSASAIAALRKSQGKALAKAEKLSARRDALAAKVDDLDAKIANLIGGNVPAKATAKRGRPAKATKPAKAKTAGKRGRPAKSTVKTAKATGPSLIEHLTNVMADGSNKAIAELETGARKDGWDGGGSNPRLMISQALGTMLEAKQVIRVERGVYRLSARSVAKATVAAPVTSVDTTPADAAPATV